MGKKKSPNHRLRRTLATVTHFLHLWIRKLKPKEFCGRAKVTGKLLNGELRLKPPQDFPGVASGNEHVCQCRRCKSCVFDPWVRKIPWKRTQQPTPVFLPGEFLPWDHGWGSLAGYRT